MKLLKDIFIILFVAACWFCSAYYATSALFPFLAFQCGLVSLIIALLGIAIINRTEEGSRLLYEGENEREEIHGAKIVIWLLIGIPVMLLFGGTLWWVMRLFGLFDF